MIGLAVEEQEANAHEMASPAYPAAGSVQTVITERERVSERDGGAAGSSKTEGTQRAGDPLTSTDRLVRIDLT